MYHVNLPKFVRILRLLSSILSIDYFVILYAPDNSQVMLTTCFLIFHCNCLSIPVPLGLIKLIITVVSYPLQNFNVSRKILIMFLLSY